MSIKTTLSGDSEMEEALFGDMELEENIGEEKGEEKGDSLWQSLKHIFFIYWIKNSCRLWLIIIVLYIYIMRLCAEI